MRTISKWTVASAVGVAAASFVGPSAGAAPSGGSFSGTYSGEVRYAGTISEGYKARWSMHVVVSAAGKLG